MTTKKTKTESSGASTSAKKIAVKPSPPKTPPPPKSPKAIKAPAAKAKTTKSANAVVEQKTRKSGSTTAKPTPTTPNTKASPKATLSAADKATHKKQPRTSANTPQATLNSKKKKPLLTTESLETLETSSSEASTIAPSTAASSRTQSTQTDTPLPPNTVAGVVIGHPEGYGFIKLDQGGEDLYLNEDAMRAVLHGDRVAARVTGFARDGKANAEIVNVLLRANHRVVGKLRFKDGDWFVVAAERRINQDILVPADKLGKAALDQIVVIEITRQPTPYDEAMGEVIEIVGNENASDIELEIAIRKHNLPYMFTAATLKEAAVYGDTVRAKDIEGRVDLRDLALVTIDGETAKDFDDAVYAETSKTGYRLLVAIADVSNYVKVGTALDTDARERTTSVYFPRRVIPMLPEALSNELCSLRPMVDRLCMVCDMKVSLEGRITGFSFYAAVMNSKARLTYTEVAAKIPELETAKPKAGSIDASLKTLYTLYGAFRKTREQRGALDFEGQEAVFSFDDDGNVTGIKPAVRNEAHKLIEEMMLAANVCAAEFLAEAKQPLLYRVHDIPLPEKLAALRETLSLRGLSLGGGEHPSPKDYAALIEKTRDRLDAPALHTLLLRSLPQAIYTPTDGGHFGLAYDHYAHFTSPIRRYPDLLVHRGIKAVIAKKKYTEHSWTQLGEMCSANERRADIASREVTQFLKAKYLEQHIGADFVGTISGVVPFGVFVTLDETFVDGLIHATSLPKDYYQLGRDKVTLEGQRSGFTLTLGERICVRVAAVNAGSGKVDFDFIERAPSAADASSKKTNKNSEPSSGKVKQKRK